MNVNGYSRRIAGASRAKGQQTAFTLVELLVVIAIIGILVALLLPAIQAAREAARRAQCQSNLRNVALAVLNYEQALKLFPIGMMNNEASNPDVARPTVFGPNWIIQALPYLEEQPLHDLFDFTRPINDRTVGDTNRNRRARGTEIPVLLCPSDGANRVYYQGLVATHGDNWARTNYAANMGRADVYGTDYTVNARYNTGPKSIGWKDDCKRGIVGINTSISSRRITDGTSKVILVGEIRAGLTEKDARGVWAMAHVGASLLAGYGAGGDDNGPNACAPNTFGRADDVYSDICADANAVAECMGCDTGYFAQATVRSTHAGGVFVAMCDGSVQFIDENIETSGATIGSPCCSPWDHLIASSDSDGRGIYNGVRRGGCE